MPVTSKNGKYFWFLNLLVIIVVAGISLKTILSDKRESDYLLRLNEVTHYVTRGFDIGDGLTGATEVPAGRNVGADLPESGGHTFMVPGELPYMEFTITAKFDYTAQYDALKAHSGAIPGIMLPGLGDSYEIYLNGQLIASEWHVDNGTITSHRLARSTVYPINPGFFVRGDNTLTFRIYGDPTTVDTGLTVTDKYIIDDFQVLGRIDYSQTAFAGIYLAVAVTFLVFFLLYREKKLNLWFSLTSLFLSLYAFFRAGAFQSIIMNYALALRLEIFSLFSFMYFNTILIYTCGKDKFNLVMKVYTGIYASFCIALLLPGHQFVLDLIKVYVVLFVPTILYVFVSSLCIPLVRETKRIRSEGGSSPGCLLYALSGTLCGNMLIGSCLPIILSMFDQISYVVFSYQEVLLSQFGFLFFFANVTFALASDIAEINSRLIRVSSELRAHISERESQLVQKSGEIEEVKAEQKKFREAVSREIRVPLGEIIGSIELLLLRDGKTADTSNWLNRLLEMERNLRKKLEDFLDDKTAYPDIPITADAFKSTDMQSGTASIWSNPGGTRHLFVINPKSFVRLNDLKDFLLSVEMCFSVGHRAEYRVYISRYPRDAYSAVYRYLAATPTDETVRVYAVGGDGILFDCLNGMAKFPNAELAPIPYGNTNNFVRSFGAGNMKLFRNIKLMSKAPVRLTDMILCGEQYALCSCSVGIEASAVHAFSKLTALFNSGRVRRFIPFLYKCGAFISLLDDSRNNMSYRLTFDGKDYSGDYHFVHISNTGQNGGGCIPDPLAIPDDGILDAITCLSTSTLHSLRMLPAYTSGKFYKFPNHMKHYNLKEFHCESDDLMHIILDGETFYAHELDMKILPKAVKIVSPNGIGFADYSQIVKGASK